MNIIGLAPFELIVIMMMSQQGEDLFYSLSTSTSLFLKLTMCASVTGGSLLRMKSDFTSVMIVILDPDIILKLNNGLFNFIKWIKFICPKCYEYFGCKKIYYGNY